MGAHFEAEPFGAGRKVQRRRARGGMPSRQQVIGPLQHESAVARAHQGLGVGGRLIIEIIQTSATADGKKQGLGFGKLDFGGLGFNGRSW